MRGKKSKGLLQDKQKPGKTNQCSSKNYLTEEKLKAIEEVKAEVKREYERLGRPAALARRKDLIRRGILKPKEEKTTERGGVKN